MRETILKLDDRHEYHGISTRDLVAPLFRQSRLIVWAFAIFTVAVFGAAIAIPRQYEAEMKILVKQERIDPAVSSTKATVFETRSEVTEEQVQSEVELIRSHDLLENTVMQSGLVPHTAKGENQLSPIVVARAVRDLQDKLRVEPIKKTNLISATYRSGDPVLAARVLNTLTNLYLEKHMEVHRLPGAFDFFEKQTERYRDELATSEQRLVGYDRDSGVLLPEVEKDIALRKQSEFEAALRETQTSISETTQRIRALVAQVSTTAPRMKTQERFSDNSVLLQQLKSTQLNLELKRTNLLTKYSADYVLVQEVNKEIEQTKEAIAAASESTIHEQTTDSDPTFAWAREELAKNEAQLIALRGRAAALGPVVESYRTGARNLDEKSAVHQDLVRAAKTAEENYLLYMQKKEEARISDALDRNRIVNVAIAESATVPALPVHSKLLILVLGILSAGFLSASLGFAADYLDPSFRTPRELHNHLDIPVLAAVPGEVG